MDLSSALALASLAGGGRGGGKTSVNQSSANTLSQNSANTNTFGVSTSVNPTIANMFGAGSTVAPSAGGSSAPTNVSPSLDGRVSSSNSPSQSGGTEGGSGLASWVPRGSVSGTVGTGPGFARPPAFGTGDDLLLLLMIGGGAVLLLWT